MTLRSHRIVAAALAFSALAACEYDPADPVDPVGPVSAVDAGVDATPPVPAAPLEHGHAHHHDEHGDEGAHGHIGESQHAIHGDAAFSGCNAATRAALTTALEYAQQRVLTSDFRECLKDAFGVEAEGRMVEELIADLNTMRGVDFTCVAGDAGANAGHDQHGNESMNIVGDFATTRSTADVAAVIAHEIAHNHAWWHNHFYGPTWPDQVQGCVYRGQPFGARRADMAQARLLSPVGGEGGTYRNLRCGEDEAMVGIRGATYADGRLGRLQPLCQDVEGSVRVGNPWTWGMSLPAGGTVFEDRCGNGKAVIGLEGSAGSYVDRVRAVCADIGDLRAEWGGIAYQNLPYHGQIRNWGYSRRCPNRTVATGMRVRTGARVDGFQLECDDFPLQQRGNGIALAGHGGWGGSFRQLECPGTMGLDGIYGQWDTNSTDLATVGGRCRVMSDQGVAQGSDWGWSMVFTERAGRTQPTENDAFLRRSYCDDDEAMVGLAISADNIVGDAVAVCADLDAWMAGDNTTRYASGLRVRAATETSRMVTCPSGQIATGLEVRSGWLIDRIDLRCKVPDVAGNLRHMTTYGGNGGTAYEEICPDGRPMIGLRTEHHSGGLRWLNGRCGRHTDTGTSVVSPIDLPTIGGDETTDNLNDCPLGKVLVGVEFAHSNRLTEWVRGICGDEDTARDGDAHDGIWRTSWRGGGGEWHTITASMCPAGEVVRGMHGRRGALQDSAGIICGKVPLLPGSVAQGSAGLTRDGVHMLTIPEGFGGDLRLRLAGSRFLHATVRIRRGALPTAAANDGSAAGMNGITWLEVDDLSPGRYYITVSANAGIGGSYDLHLEPQ